MHELQMLAERVTRDDPAAEARLRQELEAQVARIVRRVMRTGMSASPLTRRILVEAGRMPRLSPDSPPEEHERRILRVARRICDSVIGGLRTSPAAPHGFADTIRN